MSDSDIVDINLYIKSQLKLESPVTVLKDVSDIRRKYLKCLGIVSIRNLINYFPEKYLDYSNSCSISQTQIGLSYSIYGKIYEIKEKTIRDNIKLHELTIVDNSSTLIASVFNRAWINKQFSKDDNVILQGTIEFNYGFKRMTNPNIYKVDNIKNDTNFSQIVSIYPVNEYISNTVISKLINNAFLYLGSSFSIMPDSFIKKYKLMNYSDALYKTHFPVSIVEVKQARRSLKYYESLIYFSNYYEKYYRLLSKQRTTKYNILGNRLAEISNKINIQSNQEISFILANTCAKLLSENCLRKIIYSCSSKNKLTIILLMLAICSDTNISCTIVTYSYSRIVQLENYLKKFFPNKIIIYNFDNSKSAFAYEVKDTENLDKAVFRIIYYRDLKKINIKKIPSMLILEESHLYIFSILNMLRSIEHQKNTNIDILCLSRYIFTKEFLDMMYVSFDKYSFKTQDKQIKINILNKAKSLNLYASFDASKYHKDNCLLFNPYLDYKQINKLSNNEDKKNYEKYVYCLADIDKLSNNSLFLESSANFIKGIENNFSKNLSFSYINKKMSPNTINKINIDFSNKKIDVLNIVADLDFEIINSNINNIIIENADKFRFFILVYLKKLLLSSNSDKCLHLVYNSSNSLVAKRLELLKSNNYLDIIKKEEYLQGEGKFYSFAQKNFNNLKLINIQKDIKVLNVAKKDALQIVCSNYKILENYDSIYKYEVYQSV